MELDNCLILGSEPVDSSSLNRCFSNLFTYLGNVNSSMLEGSSENIPSQPFFKDGYSEYAISGEYCHPDLRSYGLSASTSADEGLVERTYDGPLAIEYYHDAALRTMTPSGMHTYGEDHVYENFAPTVAALYGGYYPLVFGALLGDETAVEYANGTSTISNGYLPTVKYTSYLLCSGVGVSFGTITFSKDSGDSQCNRLCIDVISDLIHINSVSKVLFVNVGNGFSHGISEVSEDLDMVEKMCTAKITYLDGRRTKIALTDITKNDVSDTIRIDRSTGRILEKWENAEYGTYTEISNDEYSLCFMVVFEYYLPKVTFNNSSISLGARGTTDYSGLMRGVTLLDGEIPTLDKLQYIDTTAGVTPQNEVRDVSNAFNGCTYATFVSVQEFSSAIRNASECFRNCGNADFRSLVRISLPQAMDTSHMFDGCNNSEFASLVDISIPNVRNGSYMFYNCANATFGSLEQMTVGKSALMMFANCANATFGSLERIYGSSNSDYTSMFYNCTNARFGSLASIGDATTNGLTLTNMFKGCETAEFNSLDSIGIPTTTNSMFDGCKSAKIKLGYTAEAGVTKPNLNSMVNAERMFAGCNSVELCGGNTLDSLTNANSMCVDCEKITLVKFGSNVTNAVSAFANVGDCTITELALGDNDVNDCSYAFYGTNVKVGTNGFDWDNFLSKTVTMAHAFDSAKPTNMEPGTTGMASSKLRNSIGAFQNSKFNFDNITSIRFDGGASLNCSGMFNGINGGGSSFGTLTGGVQLKANNLNSASMFASLSGLGGLSSVSLSANVVDMSSMFDSASGVNGKDISVKVYVPNTTEPSVGRCTKLFANAKFVNNELNYTIKPSSLFLPRTAESSGDYSGIFSGIKCGHIDLGNLKLENNGTTATTNISRLGKDGDKTRAVALLSGIVGWGCPSKETCNIIKLNSNLADDMIWDTPHPWFDCYNILTTTTMMDPSQVTTELNRAPEVTSNSGVRKAVFIAYSTETSANNNVSMEFTGNGKYFTLSSTWVSGSVYVITTLYKLNSSAAWASVSSSGRKSQTSASNIVLIKKYKTANSGRYKLDVSVYPSSASKNGKIAMCGKMES